MRGMDGGVKVLLLGASNIDGRSLPHPARGFAPLVNEHPSIDMTHVPFYITGSDNAGYLRTKLTEHHSDVVIIKPTASFAVQSIFHAAGETLGRRGAQIVIRIRELVRNPRILGRVPYLDAAATAVGSRVFGRAPALDGREAAQRFTQLFDLLDAENLKGIIALSGGPASPELARQQPSTPETLLAFNVAMEREARRRGYVWIDVLDVISDGGTRVPRFVEGDPLHFGEEEHKLLAEAVLKALAMVDTGQTVHMDDP